MPNVPRESTDDDVNNIKDLMEKAFDLTQTNRSHDKNPKHKPKVSQLPKIGDLLGPAKTDDDRTDDDLRKNPPPMTGYNSLEGSVIIQDQKYFDGDLGPNGQQVHAPKLTDAQWCARYERYEKRYVDPKTGLKKKKTIVGYLNSMDQKFMQALNSHNRVLILATRDYHKSSNLFRKVMRCILDQHMKVVYYSSTKEKARAFSQKVRQLLKTNPNILRDYGSVIDTDVTDRNTEFSFKWMSEASLTQRDAGLCVGSIEGGSQMGGHPDVIAVDDIVEEKVAGSEVKIETLKEWYTRQVEFMAEEETAIYVVGTPKDSHDVYAYLESTHVYEVIKEIGILEWPNGNQHKPGNGKDLNRWYYSFHQGKNDSKPKIKGVAGLRGGLVNFDEYQMAEWDSEGRVQYYLDDDPKKGLDKNRMSMQQFLLKRNIVGEEAFDAEVQMITVKVGEGALNFDEKLKFFNPETIMNKEILTKNVCAMFDQSFGHSTRSSNNVISIVSKYEDDFYIHNIFMWKNTVLGPEDKVKYIRAIKAMYPQIIGFACEDGLMNTSDFSYIQEKLKDEIEFIPVYQNNYMRTQDEDESKQKLTLFELDPALKLKKEDIGKAMRIYNQWSRRLTEGHVYMSELLEPDVQSKFNEEKAFPKNVRHCDIIDSIGSGMDIADESHEDIFLYGGGDDVPMNPFLMR